jgi:two-component system chemotaxis response regulator CheY
MQNKHKPLTSCRCLLAIADDLCAKSLRDILHNMKVADLLLARDGAAAIFQLQQKPDIDFVIAQEDMPASPGMDILKFVRLDRNWSRPAIPVLSIGWKWTREKIESHRDAGVSDILNYPVSQHSIQRRIVSALYSEQPFITTELYCGPDRRHRNKPGYQGPFRRCTDRTAEQLAVKSADITKRAPPPQDVMTKKIEDPSAMSQEALAKLVKKQK